MADATTRKAAFMISMGLLFLFAIAGLFCSCFYWLPTPYAAWETEYADGYGRIRFARIDPGDNLTRVAALIGTPFARHDLEARLVRFAGDSRWYLVHSSGCVLATRDPDGKYVSNSSPADLPSLTEKLGAPVESRPATGIEYWPFSRSPNSTHFFIKALTVDTRSGVVLEVIDELYFD